MMLRTIIEYEESVRPMMRLTILLLKTTDMIIEFSPVMPWAQTKKAEIAIDVRKTVDDGRPKCLSEIVSRCAGQFVLLPSQNPMELGAQFRNCSRHPYGLCLTSVRNARGFTHCYACCEYNDLHPK